VARATEYAAHGHVLRKEVHGFWTETAAPLLLLGGSEVSAVCVLQVVHIGGMGEIARGSRRPRTLVAEPWSGGTVLVAYGAPRRVGLRGWQPARCQSKRRPSRAS